MWLIGLLERVVLITFTVLSVAHAGMNMKRTESIKNGCLEKQIAVLKQMLFVQQDRFLNKKEQ